MLTIQQIILQTHSTLLSFFAVVFVCFLFFNVEKFSMIFYKWFPTVHNLLIAQFKAAT